MVVDHIDTNRCNNRVENLRWLTKLENVLLNEATLKRVTFLCGGDINKFIENPACLQDLTGDNQDIMWMRTVSAEEAKLAMEHISSWAKRPTTSFKMMKERERTKDFEDWLKKHEIKDTNPFPENRQVEEKKLPLKKPIAMKKHGQNSEEPSQLLEMSRMSIKIP